MSRHKVLVIAAEAALLHALRQVAVNATGTVVLELRSFREVEDLPTAPVMFRGKPQAVSGKNHERKRIEREQRRQHGQKMRGR